jgi:hypothetical protein
VGDALYSDLLAGENLALSRLLIALPLAALLGALVSWIYRRTHGGFSYSSSFNVTLIMVSVIVCLIMMTIGSNIALSLGLIGSLSIIRFRTVLKDTVDMAFLFWAIAAGLVVGSGNNVAGSASTLLIALLVLVLARSRFARIGGGDYVLIVDLEPTGSGADLEAVGEMLTRQQLTWRVRSSELDKRSGRREVIYQVETRDEAIDAPAVLATVEAMEGVGRVALLAPETNLYV